MFPNNALQKAGCFPPFASSIHPRRLPPAHPPIGIVSYRRNLIYYRLNLIPRYPIVSLYQALSNQFCILFSRTTFQDSSDSAEYCSYLLPSASSHPPLPADNGAVPELIQRIVGNNSLQIRVRRFPMPTPITAMCFPSILKFT